MNMPRNKMDKLAWTYIIYENTGLQPVKHCYTRKANSEFLVLTYRWNVDHRYGAHPRKSTAI